MKSVPLRYFDYASKPNKKYVPLYLFLLAVSRTKTENLRQRAVLFSFMSYMNQHLLHMSDNLYVGVDGITLVHRSRAQHHAIPKPKSN
jgi:hypothetical protein